MSHSETVNDAINLTADVLQYAKKKIASEPLERNCVDIASGYLISRIREMTHAALALLKLTPPTPVAIAILTRAQLEACANLAEVLDPSITADERESRARYFIKFGEYTHVRFFRNDLQGHRASLSTEEAALFDRRIKIHDEVFESFSPKQEKQNFKTWNGKSITATIKKRLGSKGAKMYSVMCTITHGDASMLHKSITKDESGYELSPPASAPTDAAGWVNLAAKQMFVTLILFLARHKEIEMDEEAKRLEHRLGLQELGAE